MHPVGFGAANPGSDFVRSRVDFHADSVLPQFSDDVLGVVGLVVAKRQQSHLFRCKPKREVAGVVLD